MNDYRIEHDTLGEVQVPSNALWGAQTQRSLNNFKIGNEKMPMEIINAIAIVKKSAAFANYDCGALPIEKRNAIAQSCDAILSGKLSDAFPLVVWQTGSGTQTNMNLNEVIANYAKTLEPPVTLSPNDDVNKSQSTNDVFPTAMRMAAVSAVHDDLLPALEKLTATFTAKTETFATIKKIGRTHLMDATPLTLGEEFSAFSAQLSFGIAHIKKALQTLGFLPVGGTAVGNGINAPKGYDEKAVAYINQFIDNMRCAVNGEPLMIFSPASNKFEAMASHDAFVELSGALKRLAVSLMKIANDIRLLASGPRCGLGELQLPENEPGSSIMPGKVNPTQCEALAMVCCQVIGNDVAITTGAMQGHLQLNVFMPLIAKNILQSIHLLSDAINSFNDHCAIGLKPNLQNIKKHYENSLMLVTALVPIIGYSNAAKIAQHAHKNDLTLKEAALALRLIDEAAFDKAMKG
ncbi:MAG: class II fumarate hydratase [Bacteroidetes bacterium]|nr:class II fumarate hydratase [Bacteroidota bacterium]MCL1969331.1 class II fumarate hydratase [Bacteroidota bacterium]MCL1969530.1 class II fumarate hydratase [Bacteroidota bacterium]